MSSHTAKIQFKNSEFEGIEQISLNEKKYYSFLGIPYAEPPVGNLRFKNPQILENYPEYLDATESKNCCIHYTLRTRIKTGCEDCLYLNIDIPKLPPFDFLLPVMVYFHGGMFKFSAGHMATPNLLIEYNIIFVTLTYRLHALGFLDLGLPDCSGNMGLKDQLCALQWVKNNIKYFGGDADNITLLGISAGSVSAHMVAMSPLNKNLSNKIILMGCNALNTIHFNPTPVETAFKLGQKFGYEGNDKKSLLELLKSVSADELLEAVFSLDEENLLLPRSGSFRPTVEEIKEGALLPDSPLNLWKKVTHISILEGINEKEGSCIFNVPKLAELLVQYDGLKAFISNVIPAEEKVQQNFFKEIISYYGISEKHDQENFNSRMNLFTDFMLMNHYLEANFLRSTSNSYLVYSYKFTYCGEHNAIKNVWKSYMKWNVEGSFHVDEYGYLMLNEKWNLPEKDSKVANNICTLWANFTKYGTPNGESLNKWYPSTKEMPCYLQIGEDLTMKYENFNSDRAEFWSYLYKKYSLQQKF